MSPFGNNTAITFDDLIENANRSARIACTGGRGITNLYLRARVAFRKGTPCWMFVAVGWRGANGFRADCRCAGM